MTSTSTTLTALTLSIASIVVALEVDASLSGGTGPAVKMTTTAAPARRAPVAESELVPETERPQVTKVVAETPELRDQVEWALSRYAEAGLELPVMNVYAHVHRSECGGLFGYFSRSENGDYAVHSCGVEFTLLHELGHAWAEHNLDEQTRAKFLELADADEWKGDDWLSSGSEHAANVLAWGLVETRINQTRTRPYDHASMLEAFGILTGGAAPLWLEG